MLTENRAIWKLLRMSARQWRTRVVSIPTKTNDGVVIPVVQSRAQGLDLAALGAMAPAFGIAQNQIYFEKIAAFETECLRIWNAADEGCNQKQKDLCRRKFGKYFEWTCGTCDKNTGK